MDFLLFLLIYKFVLSDFFVEKTGIQTFYIKDNKKKFEDNVNIILSTLSIIFPISLGILFKSFLNENIFSDGLFLYSLLFFYLSICLLIKLKYYPFIDEKDIENRNHPFTYTSIALRFNLLINIFTVLFAVFYNILGNTASLLCCILTLIYGHIAVLFPDYINKYFPVELRSDKGMYLFILLNSIIMCTFTYILICVL